MSSETDLSAHAPIPFQTWIPPEIAYHRTATKASSSSFASSWTSFAATLYELLRAVLVLTFACDRRTTHVQLTAESVLMIVFIRNFIYHVWTNGSLVYTDGQKPDVIIHLENSKNAFFAISLPASCAAMGVADAVDDSLDRIEICRTCFFHNECIKRCKIMVLRP